MSDSEKRDPEQPVPASDSPSTSGGSEHADVDKTLIRQEQDTYIQPDEPSVKSSDVDLNQATLNEKSSDADLNAATVNGESEAEEQTAATFPPEDDSSTLPPAASEPPKPRRRRSHDNPMSFPALDDDEDDEDGIDLSARTLIDENGQPLARKTKDPFGDDGFSVDLNAATLPEGGASVNPADEKKSPSVADAVYASSDRSDNGADQASIDLNAKTIGQDRAGSIDLNAATMQDGGGARGERATDMGHASDAGNLVDLESRTVSEDVQEQWAKTITEDLTEGMTIKGDQKTLLEGKDEKKATHITVNPRAVLDSSARARMRKVADTVSIKRKNLSSPGIERMKVDFELLDVLGEGGMGIVYRARQASIDRSIALKMIKKEGAQDKNVRNKFLSEAAVTGDLDHPNIVPIYDLGDNGIGALFYAMKHVRGVPWCDVIKEKGLGENLKILEDVGNAIAFAHDRGVIHRDLKPENVMLGSYGEVLVMDWGLAAAVQEGAKAPLLTARTPVCGTPAYMSPEMAVGDGRKIGRQSDVYLLGAMLYEALAGYAPHTGESVMKCLENAALNEIRETEASGELMDIAMRAMATDLDERYKSVQEFQSAIAEYQSHHESVVISDQAKKDLGEAESSREYDDFNKAVFGFQQALNMWKKNKAADEGLSVARLEYARVALDKGDLDLAESQLVEMTEPFKKLRNEVMAVRVDRDRRQRTLTGLRYAALVLVGIVLIGGTGFTILVMKEKERADKAAADAIAAKEQADEAAIEAKRQAEIAEKQKAVAEKQRIEAEKQKAEAEKQKAEAEKQRLEAERQKAETEVALARAEKADIARRLGEARENKLRDTSRWALTREEAKALQADQSTKNKLPPALTISLPGEDVSVDMAYIPSGRFTMGSPPGEKGRDPGEALHDVEISRPFYMGVLEVTREQWNAVMGSSAPTGFNAADLAPRHPVESVTYDMVVSQFLPKLNELTAKIRPEGFVWDLPTEAEWEYACRAGTPSAYFFGNDPERLARFGWYAANSGKRSHPAGEFAVYAREGEDPASFANAWGLYDVHGNVAEWCLDWFDGGFYLSGEDKELEKRVEMIYAEQREITDDDLQAIMKFVTDPYNREKEDASFRVIRGGGWFMLAEHCRSAHRSSGQPATRAVPFVGFRLVLRKADAR